MPGPQTLWPAQDSLLRLAWHALPWLAPLALLCQSLRRTCIRDGLRTDEERSDRSPACGKEGLCPYVVVLHDVRSRKLHRYYLSVDPDRRVFFFFFFV